MALNFPTSPSNGQEYVAPNGVTYIYDAAAGLWYVKTSDAIGTSDIADSAITTAKIADDAVTGDKLANDITISTTGDLTANSLTLPTGAPVVGYQEGVWTPEVAGSSSAGSYTYTNNIGRWTRMGNTVYIQGYLTNINTVSSGSGTMLIINFPYMPSSDNNSTGNVRFDQVDLPVDTVYVVPTTSNDNRCGFQAIKDNANDVSLSLSSSTFTSTSADIFMSMTYITDDTTWTPIDGATVS